MPGLSACGWRRCRPRPEWRCAVSGSKQKVRLFRGSADGALDEGVAGGWSTFCTGVGRATGRAVPPCMPSDRVDGRMLPRAAHLA